MKKKLNLAWDFKDDITRLKLKYNILIVDKLQTEGDWDYGFLLNGCQNISGFMLIKHMLAFCYNTPDPITWWLLQ